MKSLAIQFVNESSKPVTLTIPYVKEGLTKEEISALADIIIAKNVFITKGGALKTKKGAKIVNKSMAEIEIK